MLTLRGSGLVDRSVCLSGLGARCMSAVADRRDRARVRLWAVTLITYQDSGEIDPTSKLPRALDRGKMPAGWFERVFSHTDGIAAFFRQMSGGRIAIEWDVFTIDELLTITQKVWLANSGAEPAWYRQALSATHPWINPDAYDHFLWLPNEASSRGGISLGGNAFVGVIDFTPSVAIMEMTHSFGSPNHADWQIVNDYRDSFCAMGLTSEGRGFDIPALQTDDRAYSHNLTHALVGPGISAHYLFQVGWLDLGNVSSVVGDVGRSFDLDANQGAPPPGAPGKIALIVGAPPAKQPSGPQYWIEYRHPSGFDRSINRPHPGDAADFPPEGVVLARRTDTVGGALHSFFADVQSARVGNVLRLSNLGRSVRVTKVDAGARRVTVTVE
jgi:hypothetical protein